MLDELVKLVKHFLYRDAAYIIAGSTTMVAFSYSFDHPELLNLSNAGLVLFAGIGYGIGYAVQDVLCLTRLLTSCMVDTPPPIVEWLYKRFDRSGWEALTPGQGQKAWDAVVLMDRNGHFTAELHRLETLLIIGTAYGSCGLVASALLGYKAYKSSSEFNLALGTLAVSIMLCCAGWLKAVQSAQYSVRLARSLSEASKTPLVIAQD